MGSVTRPFKQTLELFSPTRSEGRAKEDKTPNPLDVELEKKRKKAAGQKSLLAFSADKGKKDQVINPNTSRGRLLGR